MVTFTKDETKDIIISVVVLTILYAISVTRSIGWTYDNLLLFIPISFVAVGLAFILHELGHKVVAQRFGFFSEYRKWDYGLILGLITVLTGFMFFAPGAVYFGSYGRMVTDEENGKISIAGPIVNIILAVIFLGLTLTIKPLITVSNMDIMMVILLTCYLAFNVNSFLAIFNLLPIPPLDGSKIMQWNIPVWLITIIIAGLLTYISYFIPII